MVTGAAEPEKTRVAVAPLVLIPSYRPLVAVKVTPVTPAVPMTTVSAEKEPNAETDNSRRPSRFSTAIVLID